MGISKRMGSGMFIKMRIFSLDNIRHTTILAIAIYKRIEIMIDNWVPVLCLKNVFGKVKPFYISCFFFIGLSIIRT